jgi:hypothetical protein
MNVEIGTEAVHFLEKEYINGIFLAVYAKIRRASEWQNIKEFIGTHN